MQRRPLAFAAAAVAVLAVLAIPLFSMRLAFADAGNDPAGQTTRQAFDLLARGFGPGFNGPLVVAVRLPDRARRAEGRRAARADRAHAGRRVRRARAGQRARATRP